jgi:hypothetical protein
MDSNISKFNCDVTVDDKKGKQNIESTFGYLSIQMGDEGQWQGTVINTDGDGFIDCGSK